MSDVLLAVLPVFLIIGVGMVVDRAAFLPSSTSTALNMYVLRLALPVLLLRIMAGAEPAELFQGRIWFGVLAAQFAMYGLGYAGDRLLAQRGHGPAVTAAMACSCSMTAFIGLPIVLNLLPGNREALVAAGLLAVTPTVTVAFGQSQLEVLRRMSSGIVGGSRGGNWTVLVRTLALNPLVLGMLLGTALCLFGTGLWAPLDRAAGLVGATAAPCVLLSLGLDIRNKLRVGFRSDSEHKLVRQVCISVIKLLVHPLLTWAVLALCGVGGVWLAVCVIMSATGVAIGCYVVADVYQTVPEENALSVVLTNILSLFVLSGFAYCFKMLHIV